MPRRGPAGTGQSVSPFRGEIQVEPRTLQVRPELRLGALFVWELIALKRKNVKTPWFIWLSFIGLAWVQYEYNLEKNKTSMTKWSDEKVNRYLGYLVRFIGLSLGVFAIPCLLMLFLIRDRTPEPWYTVWNCIILAYTYFAGVFITWRLYRYLNRD